MPIAQSYAERNGLSFLRKLADADAPPDLKQYEDASGQRDCENGSGQDYVHGEDDPPHPRLWPGAKFKSVVSSRSALSQSLEG
jgi:hypothetical protein